MIRTVFHSIACVALIAAASCVEPTYPPRLPGGEEYASLNTPELLKAPADFPAEVAIATAVPTVDFMFYPGQDYPGKP